ncbi:hypothetical protein ACFKHW_20650 [Bradyrhizobium lupini]|uniref:hypothetical protein n=1 Tax=Rhizobium lupini TaxID=136996 RepID=UPI003670E7D9
MDTSFLQDELGQIENEVVASERRLAELEALVAEKKRQRLDTENEETELHGMRARDFASRTDSAFSR